MTAELFVFGIARSGTNLIARLLDGHPQVGITLDPFLPVFNNWIRDSAKQSQYKIQLAEFAQAGPIPDYYFSSAGALMRECLATEAINTLIPVDKKTALLDALITRTALESPERAAFFKEIQANTYAELVHEVLSTLLSTHADAPKYIGVKEVWTLEFIPVLAQLFPNSKFIIVERDPRAVVSSLLKMADKDKTQLAHTISYARQWRKSYVLGSAYSQTPDLSERITVVKYEEVAHAPEVFCREISGWLGLIFEECMIDISANGWAGNSSYGQLKGVSSRSLDKWKETLDEDCVAMVEYICGPEMKLAGYAPHGDGMLSNTVINHMIWADQNEGSWRSDGGDFLQSLAWEELRHRMIKTPINLETDLIERLFLSKEIYKAISCEHHN